MKTTPELAKAVEAYQNGEAEKFNKIYALSGRYLYTCIIHVVKNEDTAQDILQETYMEIVKNIHQLKNVEDFLSWAAVIANRKCFAYLKKQKEVLLDETGLEEGETNYFETLPDDEAVIPEEIMQDKEKQRLIREIIDNLSDMQRLCVVGFYYNNQSQESIAKELDIPVNTVKSHLKRAKGKIKDAVEELNTKKDTRLYTVAPFMLLLFTEEAKACEIPDMTKELRELAMDHEMENATQGSEISKGMKSAKKKWMVGAAVCMIAVGVGTTIYVTSQNREANIKEGHKEVTKSPTKAVVTETPPPEMTVTEAPTKTPTPEITDTEVGTEPLDFQEAMGEIKASRKYDEVRGAKDGLLVVRKGDKWGLVTYDDQVVVPLEYEYACTTPNNEGQTFFGNQGDYRVFDKEGKEIFKSDRTIGSVSEGVVFIEEIDTETNGYGYKYVKLDGTVLYDSGEMIEGGYKGLGAVGFQEGNGVYYYQDEKLLSDNGDVVEIFRIRSGDVNPVSEDGETSTDINLAGYSSCFTYPIGAIHRGYYVSQGSKIGPNPNKCYIFDVKGAEEYSIDMGSLCKYAGFMGEYSWKINGINKEGNMCFSYDTLMSISIKSGEETKAFLIDLAKLEEKENEDWMMETVFPEGSVLAQGDYIGISDEKYWLYAADGKWGYIDHEGNLQETYDDASGFVNGSAMVIVDGQAHFIDEEFHVSEESVPADEVTVIGDVFQITSGNEKLLVHRK